MQIKLSVELFAKGKPIHPYSLQCKGLRILKYNSPPLHFVYPASRLVKNTGWMQLSENYLPDITHQKHPYEKNCSAWGLASLTDCLYHVSKVQ